jgi:hypothetical protein
MRGTRVFHETTEDANSVGDIWACRDSEVEEFTHKFPIGDIGHFGLLLRGVGTHGLRKLGAVFHRCRCWVTVGHIEVLEDRLNIARLREADFSRQSIAFNLHAEHGLGGALIMELEMHRQIILYPSDGIL